MVAVVERAEPAQNVRCLADHETEVGEIERDVLESEQRACFRVVPRDCRFTQVHRGQRDASLDAPFELEQFQVHVDGFGEFRLANAQGAKLGYLPGLGAGGAERRLAVGHVLIMTQTILSSDRRPASTNEGPREA
jgi:hypothetical protein